MLSMLTLITKIRKQLLWLWIGFSIPMLLLIFVQTIAGKYVEIESTPWLWAGANLLPCFVLLLTGAMQNKNAGKFIQTFIYRIILVATLAYLLLLVMTLLSMTAGSAEQSLADYFRQSYRWLLPFQLLLIGVFVLLFFRQEALFRPNEKMIKEHVVKEMNQAAAKNNMVQQQAFELLVANNYQGLFELLNQKLDNSSEAGSQTLMLQTQYNDWANKTSLGLVEEKDAQLTINRITLALIRLINNL
jgi:Effector-associated domain 11